MKISTESEQTAERSASDLMSAVKELLASAARDGTVFHWNVYRHEHVVDGKAVGGTKLELIVEPQSCPQCGMNDGDDRDDEEDE